MWAATHLSSYRKSEADKHVLEIDPVTAPVVRHILDLRLQGYGFRRIPLALNAEKVLAPGSFYYMAEGREKLRGETPYWNHVTVKTFSATRSTSATWCRTDRNGVR